MAKDKNKSADSTDVHNVTDGSNVPLQADKPKPEPPKPAPPKKYPPAKKDSPVARNCMRCTVMLLDGSIYLVDVPKTFTGQELFDAACTHINLLEKDYFALSFKNRQGILFWLHNEKRVTKQVKVNVFSFEVKFYPLDPTYPCLGEDMTRWLMCLQLRTDILSGKLPCSFVTQSLLGSYAVQADFGDWDVDEHGDERSGVEYISKIGFAPKQDADLLDKIVEIHKSHRGQSPAEAETSYLENVKCTALYGVHMHDAMFVGRVLTGKPSGKDEELMVLEPNKPVQIGVCGTGILIYKDKVRVHRFPWAKIIKISYKRNTFTVKVRPSELEQVQSTLTFKLDNYTMAKRLWKIAVEHHAFFRLKEPEPAQRATFPHFGSKFRYSGRTQYQSRNVTGAVQRPVVTIDRSQSRRRFDNVKPVDASVKTTSTDREEKYQTITVAGVPTLELKNRGTKKPGGAYSVPIAGGEDDQNLTAGTDTSMTDEEAARVALLQGSGPNAYGRVGYSKAGYPGDPGYDQQYDYNSYRPGQGPYNEGYNDDSYQRGTANYGTGSRFNGYGKHPEGEEAVPPYLDDHQREAYLNRSSQGDGTWGGGNSGQTVTTKTTTRTYMADDGTMVTEHKTEKERIIETRIEKKTTVVQDDDFFDHDKALADAILGVTGMSTDLSVEKIEIQTKHDADH